MPALALPPAPPPPAVVTRAVRPAYAAIALDDRRSPLRLDASRRTFRTRKAARSIRFSIVNYGEDPHDVAVRRVRDGRLMARSALVPHTGLGAPAGRLAVRLRPGRYVLVCTLADGAHERLGMRERITVVRLRTPAAG